MKNWIESKGSPFIIMDKEYAKEWSGLADDGYDMVCNTVDYAEVIQINGYNVLVLGDEAMPTKVICNDNEIIIIRWVYADSDASIDKIIEQTDLKELPVIENFDVVWNSLELVLFDSVDTLEETSDTVPLTIKNKHCSIKTRQYEDNNVSLIIHSITC